MAEDLLNVIVFGGSGFIGRNLVEYLIANNIVSFVRAVDKVPPQVAWFNKRHLDIFNDKRVEFKSANLINPDSAEKAFEGVQFHYAINCACETKLGQTDSIYEEGIFKVSINCATAAAKHDVRRYLEVSSGCMFNDKKGHKEENKAEPWIAIARYKYKVEKELKHIDNLKYTVLRPAIVYGVGDRSAIGGRLVIAGLYKYMKEQMVLLWNEDLCMNTVHVEDVCRAIWHLINLPEAEGQVYNIADDGKTTQGSLTDVLAEVFDITHYYLGNKASSVCKVDMNLVVEEINDKHLEPWAKLCLKNGVTNTPLSPYVHKELLMHTHLSLNTDKIKNTGFELLHPEITAQKIREIVEDYNEMQMFPKSLLA